MSSTERVSSVLAFLFSLYMVSVGLAAVYFNWEFARTNGFVRWIILGEIVPTTKALIWPYFAFHQGTDTAVELRNTPLTSRQIAEMEAKKLVLSLNYAQQGAYLLNSAPHERLQDYPNLPQILEYRRKAIEVGNAADKQVLNRMYPSLGDKFDRDFLQAMALFVEGAEKDSGDELRRSELLNSRWADWYQPRRKEIEDAINTATGSQ